LADYTQNIKVTADIKQAERSVESLEKQFKELDRLTQAGLTINVGGLNRAVAAFGQVEKAVDNVYGRILELTQRKTPSLQLDLDASRVYIALAKISGMFRRRDYRLNINDTAIKSATYHAKTLQGELLNLTKNKYVIDIEYRTTGTNPADIVGRANQAKAQGLSGKLNDILQSAAAGIGGQSTAEKRAALQARVSKESLAKGGYNIPGLKEVLSALGANVPQGRTGRKELEKLAREAVNSAEDAVINAAYDRLIDLKMQFRSPRGTSGTMFNQAGRSTPNFQEIIDRMAFSTKRPGAAQFMLRQLPESRITTDLASQASRQSNLWSEVPAARDMAVSSRYFDPLLKAISEAFASYIRSINPSWVGGIGTGARDIAALASVGRSSGPQPLLSAAAGPRALLPPVGGTGANRAMLQGLSPLTAPRIGPREDERYLRAIQRAIDEANKQLGIQAEITSNYNQVRAATERQVSVARQVVAAMRQSQRLLPPAGGIGGGGGSGGGGGGGFGGGGGGGGYWDDFVVPPFGPATLRANRLRRVRLGRERERLIRQRTENTLIGGAFPLLFGAGAGATIGGALGGLTSSNPMMSVATSALGQMLDQFAAAAVDTGKALRDPITNFQKLADAGLLASKSQEYYISRLIEVGRITEATAIIQGEMVKKIGVSGVNDLIKLGTASDDLTKAWNELSLAMYAFIAGPLAEMLKQLSNPVKTLNAVNQLAALEKDLRQAGRGKDADRLIKEDRKFKDLGPDKGTIERLKLIEQYRKLLPVATDTRTGPEAQQKAADDALAKAERAEALRRQGLQLERQTQDLDLQIADQVYGFRKRADDLERATLDLRRSIEDEIFKKRQDITRIEADNDRKRAQIAIERTDLLLNAGRITDNRPGGNLANQMLDALRQYFRSKAEGEANLQQKQRNFTIEMEDIRRAAGRFQLDVARKVDEIERQGVELARDMERAKLTTARAIYDLQVQAADYQVAKAKEALATMSDPAGLLSGTQSLTQQISGGGFSTQQLQGATAAASKFTGIANMCAESVKAFYKSLGITLPGVTAWADTVRKAGKTMTDWSKLRPGDIVATGRPGDTPHVGVYTGGNNVFHQSASRGLRAGNYPDLGYFKQGGYFVRPDVGVASRGAAPTAASIPAPVLPPPGLPASVGQATAALGRPVPGAPDVSRLLAQDKAMTQMLLNAKTTAMELDATLDGLSVEGFKQQLDLVGKSIDAALTAPLDEIVKKQKDQAAYEREYAGLIQQGTNPALAEQIAQIREQVRLQLEKVETIKTLLTDKEKELEGELAKTTNLKEQKDLQEKILAIKERLAELEGKTVPKIKDKGADAEKGAREDDKGKKIRAYVTELQASLNDTDAMIVSLARTIEGEIGSAMSNAVTNVINGTGTVQQAFSQMFANIGKAFIDMATQMLAKQAVLSILQMIGGGLAGGFKGFSGAGPYQFPSMGSYSAGFTGSMNFFADGGFVTGPTPAVVGEGGANEYVIPENKMGAAMARWNGGVRGDAVVSGADPTGSGGLAGAPEGPPQINISGGVLQFEGAGYIRQDQLPSIISQSAKQGEARALRRLQMSASARGRVGV
jgi:hypothetical protein